MIKAKKNRKMVSEKPMHLIILPQRDGGNALHGGYQFKISQKLPNPGAPVSILKRGTESGELPLSERLLKSAETWLGPFGDMLYCAQMRWPGPIYARTEGNQSNGP